MKTMNSRSIRMIFIGTVVAAFAIVVIAALQHQDSTSIAGTWQLASVDGVRVPAPTPDNDQSFVISGNKRFSWPSMSITGTWRAADTGLTLHPDRYDGKSQAQFSAETLAKFPSDTAMQKIVSKVFEDLKFTIGSGDSELTINIGGNVEVFRKKPSATSRAVGD